MLCDSLRLTDAASIDIHIVVASETFRPATDELLVLPKGALPLR